MHFGILHKIRREKWKAPDTCDIIYVATIAMKTNQRPRDYA